MTSRSLSSVAAPWLLVAIASLCAAAFTTYDYPETYSEIMESTMDGTDSINTSTATFGRILEAFNEEHKPLFPLTKNDHKGFICAIFGLMVAAGGGIGGGGILVPIYILIMGFSPKHAIPLSNITVFGGALANTFLNTKKRHPHADRPLVDWDLILIMEPLTIAGALGGAFLNKLLPEELLVVLLVALLSFTAYNTLKKAMKMYKVETVYLRSLERPDGTKESELTKIAKEEETDDFEDAEGALLEDMELHDGEKIGLCSSESTEDSEEETTDYVDVEEITKYSASEELKKILEEEKEAPMGNITMLIIMFVVVLFINLMKGGGAFPSPLGIKCGSTAFWISNLVMILWITIISCMARSILLRKYEAKKRCGYQYVEGDIEWDSRATIVYPIVCALAGFFAGMFGVGGGIVKGPLMLEMGVHPKVASGSSACMILFTSFTATTSFVVFGLLVPDYAVVCLLIGFAATFLGQIILFYLMSKYQRNSYIAFSIGGVVLLSAFLMTIQSMVSMAEGKHHHSGGICGKDT